MPTSHKPSLPTEVIPDLYVKDHMAADLLKSWWYVVLLDLEHFKGWPDVLHLYTDVIQFPPKMDENWLRYELVN